MSAFSFTASTPMSPHHRRSHSPVRDISTPSPMHSPGRLVRRLSGSAAMTPPSTTKSLRKSTDVYNECDRFIPSRAASNLEDAFERMESNDPISKQENQGDSDHAYAPVNNPLCSVHLHDSFNLTNSFIVNFTHFDK